MPEANYQSQRNNPYALEANRRGPDRGLWSVLGRAIRSTVPERRNEKFDPNMPVGGDNMPYVKPGFGRALLGDRGADYNSAAQLNSFDEGVSKSLADDQAAYHTKEADAGMRRSESLLGQQMRDRMQALGQKFRNDNILNFGRNEATIRSAQIGADSRRDVAHENSKARKQFYSTPRPQTRETRNYLQSVAESKQLDNAKKRAMAARMTPEAIAAAEAAEANKPKNMLGKALNWAFGGGGQKQPSTISPQPGADVPIPIDAEDTQLLMGDEEQDAQQFQIDTSLDDELLMDDDYLTDPSYQKLQLR